MIRNLVLVLSLAAVLGCEADKEPRLLRYPPVPYSEGEQVEAAYRLQCERVDAHNEKVEALRLRGSQ